MLPRSRAPASLTCLFWTSICCVAASCQPRQAVPEPPVAEAIIGTVEDQVLNEDSDSPLPAQTRALLSAPLQAKIEGYLNALHMDPEAADAHLALREAGGTMAEVPGFGLPIRHVSRYDKTLLEYSIRTPLEKGERSALILLLGDEQIEAVPQQHWVLKLPSRDRMNYQLLAEGDMWNIIADAQELYPEIGAIPMVLVGYGNAADAALLLANDQRYRFSGVAISGGRMGLDLPNLDELPVAYYHSTADHLPSSPWSRGKLLEKLERRGNPNIFVEQANAAEAIEAILAAASQQRSPESFQFEDYHDARAFSWLRVIAKRNEEEPAALTATLEESTLKIQAPNVTSVELDRSEPGFPEGLSKVRLNGLLYTFNAGTSLLTIGETNAHPWRRKVDTPPGLVNFFRSEKLYIVYQDTHADPQYVEGARHMATRLSQLQLAGLQPFPAAVPVIALSSYQPELLPPHRAILIGQQPALKPILEEDEGYWPVAVDDEGLRIGNRRMTQLLSHRAPLIYSLTYPPEALGKLQLALLLVADDAQGLQLLSEKFLTATSLYRDDDVRLWMREATGGYSSLGSYTFDSYWGTSTLPSTLLDVPKESHLTWNAFLEEMLIEEAQLGNVIVGEMTDPMLPTPTRIAGSTLFRFVPNKHFAIVQLPRHNAGWAADALAQAAEAGEAQAQRIARAQAEGQRVLVEVRVLDKMDERQMRQLPYELLPYSLHEIMMRRLLHDPAQFGRELIRTANELEASDG